MNAFLFLNERERERVLLFFNERVILLNNARELERVHYFKERSKHCYYVIINN